jgi:excisionase family DNA binding protein
MIKSKKGSGRAASKRYARPEERGLGPRGGAWNLKQAAEWCGIGENYLRTMAKNKEIPCAFFIGRRIIVPREGFKRWFNDWRTTTNAA